MARQQESCDTVRYGSHPMQIQGKKGLQGKGGQTRRPGTPPGWTGPGGDGWKRSVWV